ncbi:MAG: 16S rRNA (guanine(527)-N(7))-methyltransferase RsmG, partial [Angustibacter sp.]
SLVGSDVPVGLIDLIFGDQAPLALQFEGHLRSTGVAHGLLGPREVGRLWDRHILNCAVVTDLMGDGQLVLDLGSGAGLPGLAMAIRRPDTQFLLVEPMLRRADWLELVRTDLGLENVTVTRARAQDLADSVKVDTVTARAVSALINLVQWSAPLLNPGGRILAIKGERAQSEVEELMASEVGACIDHPSILQVGPTELATPTTVVDVRGRWSKVVSSSAPRERKPRRR